MATDLTAKLSENAHRRPKPILPLDLGFAIAADGRVDRHQDRLSSDTGPPSSATLSAAKEGMDSQRAAVGRIPEYHASVFDIFKKICRAERFGIPVRLSEAEKRYSRAERFGIGSACGSDEMAKSEELKRKARAERFELLTLSMATDEEAKKKSSACQICPISVEFPS